MKECDIYHESAKKITFDEFVAKGNELEAIVNDLMPGKWKKPSVVALQGKNVVHYNLPGTGQYCFDDKTLDQRAWDRSTQVGMVITGYPGGFYNIAQLLYNGANNNKKLTCTALMWTNDEVKKEVGERLFGESYRSSLT